MAPLQTEPEIVGSSSAFRPDMQGHDEVAKALTFYEAIYACNYSSVTSGRLGHCRTARPSQHRRHPGKEALMDIVILVIGAGVCGAIAALVVYIVDALIGPADEFFDE